MRTRTSKRRWKARCDLGRVIPAIAIVEHRLKRWFVFDCADALRDIYVARPRW